MRTMIFRLVFTFILMTAFCGMTFAEAMNNPLINAPQIAAITVDGDLADWNGASAWADFGVWYQGGLASESKAQYAWNDAGDMLYIGIESTESLDLFLEVGGLMGDLSDPCAMVEGFVQSTQIQFKYDPAYGVIGIENQIPGEISTGVIASYLWDGTTMTIEIAAPIYSDWTNAGSGMALSQDMSIYIYANVASSTWSAADSQVANGTYLSLYNKPTMEVASEIVLIDRPSSCGQAGTQYLDSDLDKDCYVTLKDFAMLTGSWMQCTDVRNEDCSQ